MAEEAPLNIQSSGERRPYPNFNAFRPFVMDELRRRKDTYPTPTIAPFVRLTACTEEPQLKYAFFTLGLHGFYQEDLNIFDVTYGGDREIVGYGYDQRNTDSNGRAPKRLISVDELSVGGIPSGIDEVFSATSIQAIRQQQENNRLVAAGQRGESLPGGAHPIPGITEVNINRRNIGTPFVATVKWQCYNRAQLEYLRHQLMVVGTHVVIEWGNQFSDKQVRDNILDFSDKEEATNHIINSIEKGRKYIIDNFVAPNDGNYDFLVGTVGNFSIEFNAENGIYQCTTTIYSIGEEMWGISIPLTYVDTDDPDGQTAPTTLADFFLYGSSFDRMIAAHESQKDMVLIPNEGWAKANANKGDNYEQYKEFRTNPNDYRFISWKFFTTRLIPAMLAVIEQEDTKTQLEEFLEFYTESTDEKMIDFVGNNPHLLSTDPDSLLIYKGSSSTNSTFAGAGDFDKSSGTSDLRKGRLTSGVWLNAGMVREGFAQASTFNTGLQLILGRLNAATQNFWSLQLFYDADSGRYRIVDNNYTIPNYPSFYKFNVGGKGELTKIDFNSAFPPELITQMALFALIRSKSESERAKLIKKYPSIGTTSKFIFSLNWTALENLVTNRISSKRAAAKGSNGVYSQSTGTAQPRDIDRVTGGNKLYLQAIAKTTTETGPGVRVGTPLLNSSAVVSTEILPVRNSVTPNDPILPTALHKRSKVFDPEILAASAKYNVDPNFIRAIIANESGFNVAAARKEYTGGASQGLMQIMPDTAKGMGFRGTDAELKTPAVNIEYGTKFLAECLRKTGGNMEAAASMYNGGYRPRLGFGKAAEVPVTVCLQKNAKTGICEVSRTAQVGEYGNQPYVNKIMSSYRQFATANGDVARQTARQPVTTVPATSPATSSPTPASGGSSGGAFGGTFAADATNTARSTKSTTSKVDDGPTPEQIREEAWKENIKSRFGSSFIPLIAPNPSKMVAKITKDGFENHPTYANGFVAPIPTSTDVTLTLTGIGGISISDGFYVDKLPFIFEEYGCFQTTQLIETITDRGWFTNIKGVFRLLNLDPSGPQSATIK